MPGLINAYKTATTYALQLTPIITKQIEINYELHFDYTKLNDVMIVIKQFNCSVIQQEQTLFCLMKIGIPKARLNEVLFKLNDLQLSSVEAV